MKITYPTCTWTISSLVPSWGSTTYTVYANDNGRVIAHSRHDTQKEAVEQAELLNHKQRIWDYNYQRLRPEIFDTLDEVERNAMALDILGCLPLECRTKEVVNQLAEIALELIERG